jgi:hypothetical protein
MLKKEGGEDESESNEKGDGSPSEDEGEGSSGNGGSGESQGGNSNNGETLDDHSGWEEGEGGSAAADIAKEKLKEAMKAAAEESASGRGLLRLKSLLLVEALVLARATQKNLLWMPSNPRLIGRKSSEVSSILLSELTGNTLSSASTNASLTFMLVVR